MKNHVRNITIGLVDGLTIPFALAAGLSNIITSSRTIFISCLAVIIAWSITMTIGAYLSAREHEPGREWSSSLTIGISYVAGGLFSVFPFLLTDMPVRAFMYSAMITLPALFLAGYFDSKFNDANGWAGAMRVAVTGAVVGAVAFGVAGLFR